MQESERFFRLDFVISQPGFADTNLSPELDKNDLLMKQIKDLYEEMYLSSDYFELKTLIADCLESPNGRFDNKVEVSATFRKVCQSRLYKELHRYW